MRDARAPGRPTKEASTPADLFPEIHQVFQEYEHRRMSDFIERSAGCVDLRDVTSIMLVEQTPRHASIDTPDHEDDGAKQRQGKRSERSFEVALTHGGPSVFEAHSPNDAKEWVDKLSSLMLYWTKRHRVEWVRSVVTFRLGTHQDIVHGYGWTPWLFMSTSIPTTGWASVMKTTTCWRMCGIGALSKDVEPFVCPVGCF